jgi:3-methylcrotonyl-CoA carboxylase alpha subunit
MRGDWKDGARTRTVEVVAEGAGRYRVNVDGAELVLTAEPLEGGRLRIVTADGVTSAEVTAAGPKRFVRLGTMDFVFERILGGRKRGSAAAGGGLESPMPGVITKVLVAAGDTVKQGQPLVAVEAMKMEHLVRAPRDGKVKAVRAKQGELVQGGATLIELEDEAAG